MITQQDMIDELNRIVIGYNITWDAIKNDADRAIMKINAHLGAEYPMMSAVMLSPRHRYTIKCDGIDHPIFPERYILTVVIPFIATEVLARDEEFTTIYNKYAMDFENGLFDMFQNEFNKVPVEFRQDKDVGVFFSKDIAEHKIHEERDAQLPKFLFNVYYHFNHDYYPSTKPFTIDTKKYKYGESVTVLEPTISKFIQGIDCYEFLGWALDTNTTVVHQANDKINNIHSDVHLYARWKVTCVLNISNGVLSINPTYAQDVTTLIIPPYVKGQHVEVIAQGFDQDAINLISVKLPRNNLTISTDAFTQPSLHQLILPSYDYLRDFPQDVRIQTDAIHGTSIPYLYIPYSISVISENAISGVLKIQCEIESNPSSWATNDADEITWTDCQHIDWGVANG